jgi:hypothetical protein
MVTPTDESWHMKHASLLGQIVGNLLTIELFARTAIALRETKGNLRLVKPFLPSIKQDEWVELTPLSNEEDMTWALDGYNNTVKKSRPDLMVDRKEIVGLRDAIAHGRAFGINAPGAGKHLVLLKFGKKPEKGKAQVLLRIDMTEEWFNQKIELLSRTINKLAEAMEWEKRELN